MRDWEDWECETGNEKLGMGLNEELGMKDWEDWE